MSLLSYGKLKTSKKNESIHSDLQYNPSKIVIPFSKFFSKQLREDIYIGNEKIPFKRKHPVFKALMRVEFEDAMKEYLKTL